MAQFKGTVFVSTRMFTEERFGPEAVLKVLATLPAKDRESLEQTTTVGWYPVGPVLAFHHALDELYGRGDLSLCVDVGRFSAGWAVNTILKFLLRFRSPHWIVEKSGSLWSHYHDSGRWEFDPPEDKKLCGRLHDFAVNDPVSVVDPEGREVVRGLTRYAMPDVARLAGARASDIEARVGHRAGDAIVHRDDLVVL